MDLIDRLLEFDKTLVVYINREWQHPMLDLIFQHIRETYFWVPLYLFFISYALFNFGKRGWLWILAAVLTISITDQVSSNLIKNNIFRLRPCRDPQIADQIRIFIRYCPGSSSFTSSHATNHWGFAAFVVLTLRNYIGRWLYILYFFAAMVCLAQVYVGVHFPLDVLSGGIIGACIGYGMSIIFNKKIGLQAISAQ